MISWEIWSRVVRFVGERKLPGTAFLLGSGVDQVLITSRHLCTDESEEIITIVHPWTDDGQIHPDNGTRVGAAIAPTADFAVFRLSEPIVTAGSDVPLSSDNMIFSQAAFILGYPYDLSFRPKGSSQQLPFVKGCIISAMETTGDGVQLIYVDAMLNPGFSGGPLVFLDPATGKPCFAGVISKAMSGPLKEKTKEVPNPVDGPAGIGVAVGALTLCEAISGRS